MQSLFGAETNTIGAQLITALITAIITAIITAPVTAWLGNHVFPFRRKKAEWLWEKKIWAREYFSEKISRIKFISDNYEKDEYSNRYSMTTLSFENAIDEIKNIVVDLNSTGHKIRLYLDKKDRSIFDSYIKESQKYLDEHREDYDHHDSNDHQAVYSYREKIIFTQGVAATNALNEFEKLNLFK